MNGDEQLCHVIDRFAIASSKTWFHESNFISFPNQLAVKKVAEIYSSASVLIA